MTKPKSEQHNKPLKQIAEPCSFAVAIVPTFNPRVVSLNHINIGSRGGTLRGPSNTGRLWSGVEAYTITCSHILDREASDRVKGDD